MITRSRRSIRKYDLTKRDCKVVQGGFHAMRTGGRRLSFARWLERAITIQQTRNPQRAEHKGDAVDQDAAGLVLQPESSITYSSREWDG